MCHDDRRPVAGRNQLDVDLVAGVGELASNVALEGLELPLEAVHGERHLAAGRLEAAYATIATHNPFPRITGRVCPHPCERSCNLTASDDDAVSIRAIDKHRDDVIKILNEVNFDDRL